MVFDGLGMGGAEKRALNLALDLKNNFLAQVSILGFRSGPMLNYANERGISCKLLPVPRGDLSLWQKIKNVGRKARFVKGIRNTKPDVVFPWTVYSNVFCNLAHPYTGARVTLWNQSSSGEDLSDNPAALKALAGCRNYISNSEHAAERLVRDFDVNKDSIKVIPNGVRLEEAMKSTSRWREDLGAEESTFLAGMLANFRRPKDHPALVKAWKIVVDEVESKKPMLVLAGYEDELYGESVKLARELGINDFVKFPGSVRDVSGFLAALDLGVFSSLSEGLPNGVLECMAAGLPVVATDLPGVREALGPGSEDILAPSGDHEALAEKIIDLIRDLDRAKALGESGRVRAEETFNPAKAARLTAEYLAEILKRKNDQ